MSDLPSPSPAVVKLIDLLNRTDADNDEIIRVVQQDGVISAKLLALCNSAAFGGGARVASVNQALLLLGQQEVHQLVMAVSFGSTLRRQRPGSTVEDLDLWRHSLLTALAAPKVLSKTTTLDAEPSIAYTTGLVHDIGKLLISCVVDRATRAAAAKLIVDGTHSSVEAERATLGTDHCEVGALLLERWQLPDVIVEAVARHHDPNLDPKPTLAAVVCVADAAAHEAQIPTDGETFNRLAVPPVLEALRLGPEKTAALIAYANDQLDKVNRFSRLG